MTTPAPRLFAPRLRKEPLRGPRSWVTAIRHSLMLIAFSVFLLIALWVAVVYQIRRESVDAIRNAQVDLTNLTRAFTEHTSKTLMGADQAIRFVRSEYADHGKNLDIATYLTQKAIVDSTFHLVSIIGPDGFVTNSSQPFQRIDLRDREHFRVHAQGSQDRLFISKPVLGRVSGKWSIQLTRRITAPDGSFGGVVVLSLSPEYLTRFYSDVDLGKQGAITLVGFDGVIRARATHESVQTAQNMSDSPLFQESLKLKAGTVRATSRIDHIERIWAFRTLDEYGLMVFTGMGTAEVMAEGLKRRQSYLISAALITLVVIGFVASLVRREQMQQALMGQLEASNQQANQANQMKTKFLASVSHELRTPLNGILGYAELLQDGSSEEETREFGQIIHQSAKHLHSLVNTVLDLAKIESGRMTLNLTRVKLHTILSEAHALNAMHAQARGLELRLEMQPDCPPEIITDSTRLTQILNNLIHNAIKFTDVGRVTIAAQATPAELVIVVSDTGSGIPPALRDGIFTHFHATSTTFIHPAQGAGLGLPLARELVALLGGSIAIDSEMASGTRITVRLPVAGPPTHTEKAP